MLWDDFYDRYSDWSETTVRSRISSLETVGRGEDVVDVVMDLDDSKLKEQLVRKAMRLGVRFSQEDFMNLDGELSDELYEKVAQYGNFYLDNPYFDPNDFTWDDFYNECGNLPEEMQRACVSRITEFGPAQEVTEAILMLTDSASADILYECAIRNGVKFSNEQLEEIGHAEGLFSWVDDIKKISEIPDEDIHAFGERLDDLEKTLVTKKKSKKKLHYGFWTFLIFMGSGKRKKKKKHDGRCDGDCDNCPAHYGYRYGRWYYGHGHQHGCTFGGNGGRWGKCYRS